jgi:hypothetical protein
MGYRSDVGYKIKFDKNLEWLESVADDKKNVTSKDLFNLFVTEAKSRLETKLCFEDEDDTFTIDDEHLSITFFAESVKWYESFEDVQCHEKLLELADDWITQHEDDDKFYSPLRWGFVRIGEERDDVDERCNNEGYDLVYLTRGISFD